MCRSPIRLTTARLTAALFLSFSLISDVVTQTNDKPLMGFDQNGSLAQRELERRFDSFLKRENLREWMKRLSARPHHVGSPYDRENAEFILSLFKSWGYDAAIEEFQVLFPTPKVRFLELTSPLKFTAKLEEPALTEDATSNQKSEQLPTYNAYSIDGDVTGQLVYVNYGVPRDYEELNRRGIDVKGKIVIARYGGSWRGIKPKVAAEHGAIGCLIYSDPRDDGYYNGDVYPKGAWRNENGAQRGSVADMPLFPGDPLTPGVGATKEAKRLSRNEAPTLTKIPVLPISYNDALPLLKSLTGPMAPDSWRGALPLPYHIGPGPAIVHLRLEFNWKIETIRNVVAKLKGSASPDQWIIRGNHHDAWVNGADDPLSGAVALLEEARAVSELTKTGWKPKRTIVYCLWDGEEPGLLGSTEWVENHAEELSQKAVVYINSDSNGRGFLGVGGSHTLEKFVNEVARDVVDPEKKISVADRLRASRIMQSSSEARAEARAELRDRYDLRITALGSGSDYTPFLQHLGIASLNIGYGGEDGGGSYHSIYDSFDHYTRFGDPNFDYGMALAQTTGRMVVRLTDADVLPFEFTNFADTVSQYVREIMRLSDDTREEIKEKNRRIDDGTLAAVFDPTETYVMPKPEGPLPYLNFAPLQNALSRLQESAKKFQTRMLQKGAPSEAMNGILMKVERAMINSAGLPRREWFKHQIYAPGFYTGYGVKTLPGVREAIEQHNWKEATAQILTVANIIEAVAIEIERAAALPPS